MQQVLRNVTVQCGNRYCDAVNRLPLDDGRIIEYPRFVICPSRKLCAECIYKEQLHFLQELRWQFSADSEEFAAVERAIQGHLNGGVVAVMNGIMLRPRLSSRRHMLANRGLFSTTDDMDKIIEKLKEGGYYLS